MVQKLFDEINDYNLEGVRICLEQGIDCNRAGHGETPLRVAVTRGADDEPILLLLNHGADINRGSRSGEIPLIPAARMGYPGIVRLLLKHEAGVHIQSAGGRTALRVAKDEVIEIIRAEEKQMQTALRLTGTVQPGGRIEVSSPQLLPGESVEIIVLLSPETSVVRRLVADVLAEAPGHLAFQTAEEVDAFVGRERDAWGR